MGRFECPAGHFLGEIIQSGPRTRLDRWNARVKIPLRMIDAETYEKAFSRTLMILVIHYIQRGREGVIVKSNNAGMPA